MKANRPDHRRVLFLVTPAIGIVEHDRVRVAEGIRFIEKLRSS